jgi:hypothetical protein
MKLIVTILLCICSISLLVSTPSEAAVAPPFVSIPSRAAVAPLAALGIFNPGRTPATCVAVRTSSTLEKSTCCDDCYQTWLDCQDSCGSPPACNACWRAYVYYCVPSCGGC